MTTSGKVVAGFVLLSVGALLIVIAIVLIIYLLDKRRKNKKAKRAKSPDAFKVVYKVPTANGTTTKVSGDMFDGRSVHTLRSEAGYKYVTPSVENKMVPPVVISPPSVITSNTLPRATSVDHVAVTLPRTGQRFVVPAPNGTLPRILVPVSRKEAKQYKKSSKAKPLFVYDGQAQSVLSAPGYATSARSGPAYATSARSVPAYATSARRAPTHATSSRLVTSGNSNYYMYGSTPNLAASQYTQPVLMYDRQKRSFFTDDLVGGNAHVQNWLSNDDQPTSLPGDETDFARPGSRTSSGPTDLEQLNSSALHMKWSPKMRRRLEEMDRREQQEQQERANQASHSLQHEVAPDGRRYTPLHHYTELSEEF